ncbi:chitin deacetylase, partial [Mortierella claussenii]
WSHCGLTTLTNEQIVAEVRWTEKIIRDVTGLTMKYIRPPYGDVDNRVREILRQMGYSTVIWTLGWDTNDWRVALRQIQVPEIIKTFKNALDNRAFIKSPAGLPAGPITLEHDLTDDTIELAKQIIPMGMSTGLQPKSLAQCLNDNNPYRGQPQPKQNGNKNGISGSAKPAPGSGSVASNGSTGNSDADGSSKDDVNGGSSTSSAGNAAVTIMAPNGSQAMGYISMGLAVVASYMLAL